MINKMLSLIRFGLAAPGSLSAYGVVFAETVATYGLPEAHVAMYTSNLQASIQKRGGVLTPLVSRGTYRGEKVQLVSKIGTIEFTRRDVPYQDTLISEVEHKQRWIVGAEEDAAVLIDRLDTIKMIWDPQNPYVEAMREGAARKMDALIMSKFFADAKTGKDGNTTTAYKTANTVAHGGTGLTVAKLRALRKLMKKRHIDMRNTRPYIAVTSEEIDDLLAETQVVSSDYNAIKPLVDGEVSQFMGFNFVPYESWGDGLNGFGIPTYTDSGTVRQLPVWIPQGMHFGLWDALTVVINNRPDKNNIKQIHAWFTDGATRTDEDMVFMVEAKE